MTDLSDTPSDSKRPWRAPRLVRLGTVRDIAGAKGGTLRNGVNDNRIPS